MGRSALYDPLVPKTRPAVLEQRLESARAVGRKLALAREAAGLSQAEAARRLGVPQSRIGKLELGMRSLMFIEGLRLARLYGVAPATFDDLSSGPDQG